MDQKNREIRVAFCLAGVLFLIGVVCYAAFPLKHPEAPVRIAYAATAGKVLFDHKEHTSEDGYGYVCLDCHHAWKEASGKNPVSCGVCHLIEVPETEDKGDAFDHDTHADEDGYGIDCIECHHAWDEDSDEDPVSCGECHEEVSDDPDMLNLVDAFHQQCIGCHEEDGTAPTDCSACHKPAKKSDALHAQCIECHEESGTAPVACTECHIL